MIIFPAIDIQGGKAVRLRRGDKTKADIFADNPVDAALMWRDQGARWLHVVDLDGAFAGRAVNAALVAAMAKAVDLPIQLGGGARSAAIARQYLDAGITRLIVGTLALENAVEFAALCAAFPGRVGVSLDAENGILKSRGWVENSGKSVADVLPLLEAAGASFIVYTDIERDGMRAGINAEAIKKLLGLTRLPVIGAGGVTTMADVMAAAALAEYGCLAGIISGRALYEKTLDLKTAQDWLDRNAPDCEKTSFN